ncbi:MAG: cyclase [Actinomycetota bacterium]
MARLFIRHSVSNYDAWRTICDDEGEAIRQTGGVTTSGVYRSVDDANDITVVHDLATLDQAKALASDPRLREAMARAGVVSEPRVWFTEEA